MLARYKTIYADPPWLELGGRGADRYYSLMTTEQIKKLKVNGKLVSEIAEENAHLYLWTTNNFLPDALKVMKAWGFQYKTMVTWVKDSFGLGYYFRGQTEHCLFGVRGKLPRKDKTTKIQGRTVLIAPKREHSRKPEEMRKVIELISYPPYIELFSRRKVEGWDSWGNEAGGTKDITHSYYLLVKRTLKRWNELYAGN